MKPTPSDLRIEFWQLPDDARVTREHFAAAAFSSVSKIEALATRGEGPVHVCPGRRALYRKGDVRAWLECQPQLAPMRSTSTA